MTQTTHIYEPGLISTCKTEMSQGGSPNPLCLHVYMDAYAEEMSKSQTKKQREDYSRINWAIALFADNNKARDAQNESCQNLWVRQSQTRGQ